MAMQTTITARHCEVDPQLRERADSLFAQLAALARSTDGTAIFDREGTARTAELRLHLAHGDVLVAHGSALDHRSALDQAAQRIKRQLLRVGERILGGRQRHPGRDR